MKSNLSASRLGSFGGALCVPPQYALRFGHLELEGSSRGLFICKFLGRWHLPCNAATSMACAGDRSLEDPAAGRTDDIQRRLFFPPWLAMHAAAWANAELNQGSCQKKSATAQYESRCTPAVPFSSAQPDDFDGPYLERNSRFYAKENSFTYPDCSFLTRFVFITFGLCFSGVRCNCVGRVSRFERLFGQRCLRIRRSVALARESGEMDWPGRVAGTGILVGNFRPASGAKSGRKGHLPRLLETVTFEPQQCTFGASQGTSKVDMVAKYIALGAALYAVGCTCPVQIEQAPPRTRYPCSLYYL